MAFDSTEVAWRDLEVFLEGKRIVKITSLKENPSQESEYLYGAGDEPFDINTGNRAYPLSLTVYKSVVDAMNRESVKAGFRDLMEVPWTIVANYKQTANAPRQTNTYPGVRIEGWEAGMEQNAKSMLVPLTAKSMRPIRT